MIEALLLNQSFHLPSFMAAESASCGSNSTCSLNLPQINAGSGELNQILTIAFGVIAALSVLMIVIAGLRFITAQGNPQELSKARSTIVYALAGLLIALAAEALVQLVIGHL